MSATCNIQSQTEVNLLVAAATTPPAIERMRAMDRLITKLKADGNWSKLDCLWIFAGADSQIARLNWKNPGTYTAALVSSPTFTADRGFIAVTSSCLDSTWKPSDGINYTRNNASAGIYCRTDAAVNSNSIGATDSGGSTGLSIRIRNSTSEINCRLNSNNGGTIANTNSKGLFYTYRTTTPGFAYGKNGVDIGSVSSASDPLYSANTMYMCGSNAAGTVSVNLSHQLGMCFVGSGDIDFLKLYNAIQDYMRTVGAAV